MSAPVIGGALSPVLTPPRLGALALGLAALAPWALGPGYELQVGTLALLNAIVVLGLNVVTGWTGQMNFGQAAFYGIGAYVTAVATKAGVPWAGAFLLSTFAALAASLALGLPTLRLRTVYLAMATIGFGEIVRLVLMHWEPVTGGSSGLRGVPPLSVLGLGPSGPAGQYFVALGALALAAVAAGRLRGSPLGRAMIATRESEIAAELAGVDTVAVKLRALAISAVFTAGAGALYAPFVGSVSPDSFTNTQAVLLFTMLVVGGTGSIPGAILGALALTALPEALRFLGQWYLVLYGLGVIGVIVLAPGGLASAGPRLGAALIRLRSLARPSPARS